MPPGPVPKTEAPNRARRRSRYRALVVAGEKRVARERRVLSPMYALRLGLLVYSPRRGKAGTLYVH
jgi:hypothetical protein